MPQTNGPEDPPSAVAIRIALTERDRATGGHCDRVAALAIELGKECALPQGELQLLRFAAALHDIGKIGIPDEVLHKSTRLTADDWAIMKTHPIRGERIVVAAGLDGEALGLAVRHHHERFDGGGYPDGLAGEKIPLLSRIVAVVDAYDAMAAMRHYSQPRTHASIMAELEEQRGQQHDAYLVGLFARVIARSDFRASR